MRRELAPSVGNHDRHLRGIAAYGLAGTMHDLPAAPLDDASFDLLLSRTRMARLSGLLWKAVADGAMPVTRAQADRAEDQHIRSLAAALVLERLLLQTLDLLEGAELPVRILKGTAIAHLDFPEVGMRTFGDIDLMVPGTAFDEAVALLCAQGHQRLHPQPRPGFDRRFSKGTSFRTVDGLEIDLHRTFTMGPLGIRLDLESLWSRSESFELGGRKVCALATEERFLHACYHAVLGETSPRLVPLRDVAQIALGHHLDMVRLHDLIRSSRAEAVVARAVRMAWSELDLADILAISAWAHTYRSNPREAAEIAAYGDGSSYASKSVAALRSIRGLRNRAAYLFALVMPADSYVDKRHRSRYTRLRTGLQQGLSPGGRP